MVGGFRAAWALFPAWSTLMGVVDRGPLRKEPVRAADCAYAAILQSLLVFLHQHLMVMGLIPVVGVPLR